MDQEKKKPVLLFTSREICYYSADFFMNQMAEAFETLGYPARLCVLDLEKDVDAQLAPYVGNSYTAVLDINSLLPRAVMDNGTPYLEQLDAPFYNYLVDHPFYHHPGLSVPLKNYHVLCLDENHVAYAKKYYPHLESVSLLPLGATKALVPVPVEQKKESVLFIGTYNCAADVYREMEELPQGLKADDKALIDIMLADSSISQEEAFRSLLAGGAYGCGVRVSDEPHVSCGSLSAQLLQGRSDPHPGAPPYSGHSAWKQLGAVKRAGEPLFYDPAAGRFFDDISKDRGVRGIA